jgi:hypothetical protein
MSCRIRSYAPDDRDAVRAICCDTGCMGRPVEALFGDRRAFADFFTRYYTDFEPDGCLVAEDDGHVVGYLIACRRPRRYRWRQPLIVAASGLRIAFGLLRGRYDRKDRRFLRWFVCRSFRETPRRPRDAAHFHINLLPGWRDGKAGRKLVFGFLRALERSGVPRVYGQIQTYEDRRPARVFERYGFHLFDRRRVTKFEPLGQEGVYVSTFVKELRAA